MGRSGQTIAGGQGTPVQADTPIRELKAFYHGQPSELFTFARFYWPTGEEARESIAPRFLAKRRPAAAESRVDTASLVEVLLRHDVGQDYVDPDFLVRSYEEHLPLEETGAFLQVTMRFPNATNLHGPYEFSRAWLRRYFVEPHGLPVMAVRHAPHLVGSDSPVHVHGLVLLRRLSPFSWLTIHRDIANDNGAAAAKADWDCFRTAPT